MIRAGNKHTTTTTTTTTETPLPLLLLHQITKTEISQCQNDSFRYVGSDKNFVYVKFPFQWWLSNSYGGNTAIILCSKWRLGSRTDQSLVPVVPLKSQVSIFSAPFTMMFCPCPSKRSAVELFALCESCHNALALCESYHNAFAVCESCHNTLALCESYHNAFVYTPAQRSLRGYTGFTLSVRPSIRLSVEYKSSLLWNFNFKFHMHDGGHRQEPIDFQQRHFQNGRLAAILDFLVSRL